MPTNSQSAVRTAAATQAMAIEFPAEQVAAKVGAIYAAVLRESKHVRAANFTVLGTDDLARLFDLYDAAFFAGLLRRLVNAEAGGRLSFRLSPTMSRAGGKTIRIRPRSAAAGTPGQDRYEIAVSTKLLFTNFADAGRPVTVCGMACGDRLTALQRVFEHELIHLLEMLVWGTSSCRAGRFHGLARRVFAHAAFTHDLVTSVERAATQFDVRPGDAVSFEFRGARHRGVVNRITDRATVLVEDPAGRPYSDGKRYRKVYVPLEMLKKEPR